MIRERMRKPYLGICDLDLEDGLTTGAAAGIFREVWLTKTDRRS
jgi:hypothetical protein